MARSKQRLQLSRRQASKGKRYYERYINQLFLWWRVNDGDPEKMATQRGFRGLVPVALQDEIHDEATHRPRHWHALTISYCRDPWGKTYKLLGYAQTPQSIVALGNGILPLLQAALRTAEETANTQQVYARAVVVAPWSSAYPSLVSAVRARREELSMDERELASLEEMTSAPSDHYLYDEHETRNIDQQIANMLG